MKKRRRESFGFSSLFYSFVFDFSFLALNVINRNEMDEMQAVNGDRERKGGVEVLPSSCSDFCFVLFFIFFSFFSL